MSRERMKKRNMNVKPIYQETVQTIQAEERKMVDRLKKVKQKIGFG